MIYFWVRGKNIMKKPLNGRPERGDALLSDPDLSSTLSLL